MDEKRITKLPGKDELVSPDDFLIVELDDRLEFGAVLLEDSSFDNTGCNGTACTVNASC